MITSSNSLCRERDAQSSGRCSTSHHVRFRAVPRTNRTLTTVNIHNHSATSNTTGSPDGVPSLPWQCSCVDASPGGCTDVSSQDGYAPPRFPFRAFKILPRYSVRTSEITSSNSGSVGIRPSARRRSASAWNCVGPSLPGRASLFVNFDEFVEIPELHRNLDKRFGIWPRCPQSVAARPAPSAGAD